MNAIFARTAGTPHTSRTEANIIGRREIEPLLAKARQTVIHYSQAVDCSAVVQNKTGRVIEIPETEYQMRFCELCGKYCYNLSGIWEGLEYPCAKIHLDALAESRRTEGAYIYTCIAGFIYWTSPLYRNGRYAGALTAGQVLVSGRKAAEEKFRVFCKDKTASEKFIGMLEEIPEKNHKEIEAMARLLGVCAGEISEKKEESGGMFRRTPLFEDDIKSAKDTEKIPPKRNLSFPGTACLEYPLEKERMLIAAFRRGDTETGCRILKELIDRVIAAVPDNFEIIRFRAIELVVLLSRSAASGNSGRAILEANNRHFRRIQESKNQEELFENLNHIAEHIAEKIFSFRGIRHASVLRRAERYIWKNYTGTIGLRDIAKASGLSAPYFSTIFKEEMGENLSSYLNRLRVEKAAALLTESRKNLKEIVKFCGFEDQSWFSKIFKTYTGMSPGKYRENNGISPEIRDTVWKR